MIILAIFLQVAIWIRFCSSRPFKVTSTVNLKYEQNTVAADFAVRLTSRIFKLDDSQLNEIDADFGINAVVEIAIEAIATAFFDHSVVVNA